MNNEKTIEILKILIASCKDLETMCEDLGEIGFRVEDSAIERVKSQLMECVYIMFGVGDEMAGDKIVYLMLNTKLSEEQILEGLIKEFGLEVLEK
jgi:hypothetical protein